MLSGPGVGDSLDELRTDLRSWIAEHLPQEWRRRPFPRSWPPDDESPVEAARSWEWHRRLDAGGWIAPGWPVEHGGRGLDLDERVMVATEFALAGAPTPIGFQGIDILGPAVIAFGTAEQQRTLLPSILSARTLWCQGYSEPDAGSDLASILTVAIREGDRYIVRGRKVWTSYGMRANDCFLLARTGTPDSRHRGLTMLYTSMSAPGIEWRPIRQLNGDGEFGELLLDDVTIPVEQRIGDEGAGWQVAMESLAHERLMAGSLAPVRSRLEALLELARNRPVAPAKRLEVAKITAGVVAAEGLQAAALRLARTRDRRFGAWSSMVKVASSRLRQEIAALALSLLGVESIASDPCYRGVANPLDTPDEPGAWARELLDSRAATLYAGTSEVLLNVVGEHALGLPKT